MKNFKEVLAKSYIGTAYRICGKIIKSPAKGQVLEMMVEGAENHYAKVVGTCEETDGKKYPLAGKNISMEKLREIAHLRPRSKIISSVCRVRNNLAYATHLFFQTNGF